MVSRIFKYNYFNVRYLALSRQFFASHSGVALSVKTDVTVGSRDGWVDKCVNVVCCVFRRE